MLLDEFGRPLKSLRISVTDRCNLRCRYCMPEDEYRWLPREDLLSFEEIARVVAVGRGLGLERVRLTGGEPLLRRDLHLLISHLAQLGIADLALTTNGLLLGEHAPALRAAGLRRLTVSLDSLRAEVFLQIAQRGSLDLVLKGLETARRLDFKEIKIDTVLIRGRNDGEIISLLNYAREIDAEIRFIEYMDVGGATHWSSDQVVSRAEILAQVVQFFGPVEAVAGRGSAPAERFRLPGGQVFGIIASVTEPFCQTCDRARLTADGQLLLCLYAREGLDLRGPLRQQCSERELSQLLAGVWGARRDRGAEARRALPPARRGSFVSVEDLRLDPRLEMHTRGG